MLLNSERSNWHTIAHRPTDPERRQLADAPPTVVETVRLAELLATRATDFVRMDLEGFEETLFADLVDYATGCIAGSPVEGGRTFVLPSILFETHPEYYSSDGASFEGTLTRMATLGYRCRYLVADRIHAAGTDRLFSEAGYAVDLQVANFPMADRAIYEGVREEVAFEMIARTGAVHAALLEPDNRSIRLG